MPDTSSTDQDLLRKFLHSSDQRAFAQLVDRYLSLVYSAARRRLSDPDLAEEVSLAVFTTLSKKANGLTRHPSLAGWLQKTAAYQAMRAGEKEQTRARKMREFRSEATVAATGEAEPPPDPETVEALDAALLALPESDRQTILLRFYRQLSFKAIGEVLGKSGDACQKQSGRAVEKLRRHFQQRGIAISVIALGSVLTSELAKATPTTSSPAIAAGALAQNAQQTTALISTAKVAALLGVAAVSISGYVIGRAAAETSVAAPSSAPTKITTRIASERLTALTKPPKPAEGDHTALLRRILELARVELREADYDPAAGRRAFARIAQFKPDDIPIALDIVARLPGGHASEAALTDAILQHWAITNGRAACEFSLSHRATGDGYPVKVPLGEWAKHEPRAAYDWFVERDAATPAGTKGWDADIVVRPILSGWVAHDPNAAIALANSVSDKGLSTGIYWGMLQHGKFLPEANRRTLLDYLHERFGKDPSKKNIGLTDAIDFWGGHRPAEFAEWIESKPEGELHPSAETQLFRAWQSVDPGAAVIWFLDRENAEDPAQRKTRLVEAWAASDAAAATRWLAGQPHSQELDGAYAAVSRALTRRGRTLMRREPDAAQERLTEAQHWAKKITNENLRSDVLEELARR